VTSVAERSGNGDCDEITACDTTNRTAGMDGAAFLMVSPV